MIAVSGPDVALHTRAFAEVAAAPRGDAAAIDGAVGLALTALDLLADPALRAAVRADFEAAGGVLDVRGTSVTSGAHRSSTPSTRTPSGSAPFADRARCRGRAVRRVVRSPAACSTSTSRPARASSGRGSSASSHTRGHGAAKDHTRAVLSWLEASGPSGRQRPPVLELEVSKVDQLTALRAAGHRRAAHRRRRRHRPSSGSRRRAEFPTPFVTKHNQGGKGLGVQRFDDARGRSRGLRRRPTSYEEPVDGITLLQEYVAAGRRRTITRVEIVGGEFVYAIRADTPAAGSSCAPPTPARSTRRSAGAPPERDRPEPGRADLLAARGLRRACSSSRYLAFAGSARHRGRGIEFIEAADGRVVTYDVNTNTNYNAAVEAVAPRSGPRQIARLLGSLLAKEKA